MLHLLLACHGGDQPRVETNNLAPLEDNRADWPDPVGGNAFPEVLSFASGGDSDLWWAHARGYIDADLADVWDFATDPDVAVDRREVDEWEITQDPQPQLDASWRIHNVVHDVITVDFEVWWRYERQDGTEDDPLLAVGQWDKVEGTGFIDILEGSIALEAVPGERVTAIELEEHLKAALRDDATLVQYLTDLHANLAAAVHGRPLPTFD